MAVAPRAKPEDFFDAAEWRALSRRGLWLVAHCCGVFGLAMAMATLWPATLPLSMCLGCR